MLRSLGYVALCSVLLVCCGTSTTTPSGNGDAATGADTGGPETSTAGGSGGASGASGASGGGAGVGGASGGSAGSGGASAGSAGAMAGRGGSGGGGGASGASGGGQAGSSGGDRDAARDAADASGDASLGADRNVDSGTEAGTDTSDARADTSAPPSDGSACTQLPSAGVYATFRVVNDVFYASITNPPGIDQAIALWRGQSQAKIPTGQLECGNGTYNCGYTWRMNPAGITFAEITIEVCDATPSYVQNNCTSFPNGQYCPWSAELTALRDCRTDASCPAVPR
jgi:hypothetical protein